MREMKIMNQDYFCTWCEQGRAARYYNEKATNGEPTFQGDQGGAALASRDGINEETVFGENGWIHYYPEVRKDLYFLIDDGWDVNYRTVTPKDFPKFGSHDVNEQRFPSFHGTPDEKLKEFVERVKAAGWKGLGIMGGLDTVPCGTHAPTTVRWHRIAPPFVGGETYLSEEILTDYFDFKEGSIGVPSLIGRRIHQSAPAVISRNTPLPEVTAKGEKPFVVASLNPTGAYSVAALERLLGTEQILKAEVRCMTETNPTDIGIFGEFENVTFCFSKEPTAVKMKNLLTDELVDVTGKITLEKELKVSGDVLQLFKSGKDRVQSAIHMMVSFE